MRWVIFKMEVVIFKIVVSFLFFDLGFLVLRILRNGILGYAVSVIVLLEVVGYRRELWNLVISV